VLGRLAASSDAAKRGINLLQNYNRILKSPAAWWGVWRLLRVFLAINCPPTFFVPGFLAICF